MNLALGHAFNLKNLFENFPYKKLKTNCKKCQEIIGKPHRQILVLRVFMESLRIILNDIIENNVTFQLPTGGRKSDIHVTRVTGDDFIAARQNGKWLDIDYLNSLFSGYRLTLSMYDKDGRPTRVKPIYTDKHLNKKLTDLVNQGKQYC